MNDYKIDPFYTFNLYPSESIRQMNPINGAIDIMPNTYYITSYGRVFSTMQNYVKELSTYYLQDGYQVISLNTSGGGRRTFRISRLVCLYFKFFDQCWLYEVDHINGDHKDNHVDNLRWVTHIENMQYAIQNGQVKHTLSEQDVIDIKRRIANNDELYTNIARDYGISPAMITSIKLGKSYGSIKTEYDSVVEELSNQSKLKKYNTITVDMVRNIFNDCKIMSDDDVSKKYNISEYSIYNIRTLRFPYNEIIKDEKPIIRTTPRERLFNDEEAIEIYNCLKSGMSVENVASKYNCGVSLIFDIKLVRNSYANLAKDYGLTPIKDSRRISKDTAIEAYAILAKGCSNKEVQEKYNLSEDTVSNIKFCRKAFEYLRGYGCKPLAR